MRKAKQRHGKEISCIHLVVGIAKPSEVGECGFIEIWGVCTRLIVCFSGLISERVFGRKAKENTIFQGFRLHVRGCDVCKVCAFFVGDRFAAFPVFLGLSKRSLCLSN